MRAFIPGVLVLLCLTGSPAPAQEKFPSRPITILMGYPPGGSTDTTARALAPVFERILGHGMVDVARTLYPDDAELFTWWAPWRNMRERNIGWRIDHVLVSSDLAPHVRRAFIWDDVRGSDHCPVGIDLLETVVGVTRCGAPAPGCGPSRR
jgi:hypothetical protein